MGVGQTALREWAYAKAYTHSDGRTAELPIWLHRYNWHRPHGSLKANTYQPPRSYRGQRPEVPHLANSQMIPSALPSQNWVELKGIVSAMINPESTGVRALSILRHRVVQL